MIRVQLNEVSVKCCYYKHLWELHHVSPILRQISEHLQDALLTKLLGQFIELRNTHFFIILENFT